MISPELRARIRRLFYAEHWKMGTIAAELGVHRDTVALAVEPERFTNIAFRPTVALLDPVQGLRPRDARAASAPPGDATPADDPGARIHGLGLAAASLRAGGPTRRRARGVLPPLDAARRARAGRLGQLRLHHHRQYTAAAVVLRDGAVLVARASSPASYSTRRSRASCAATSRRSPRSRACREACCPITWRGT